MPPSRTPAGRMDANAFCIFCNHSDQTWSVELPTTRCLFIFVCSMHLGYPWIACVDVRACVKFCCRGFSHEFLSPRMAGTTAPLHHRSPKPYGSFQGSLWLCRDLPSSNASSVVSRTLHGFDHEFELVMSLQHPCSTRLRWRPCSSQGGK